jgi:hypothetical protein
VLIDRHMPTFDVAERHATVVDAPAERTYAAARGVDLAGSAVVRALFAARRLPALVRRTGKRHARTMTLDDLVRGGFVLLEDDAPEEMVLGVVGTFWTPRGGIRRVPAEAFAAFDERGFAKAVWNFRVVPDGDGRSFLSTETRVRVPDDASRRKFLLYWSVVGPFSAAIRKRTLALIATRASAPGAPPGTME